MNHLPVTNDTLQSRNKRETKILPSEAFVVWLSLRYKTERSIILARCGNHAGAALFYRICAGAMTFVNCFSYPEKLGCSDLSIHRP